MQVRFGGEKVDLNCTIATQQGPQREGNDTKTMTRRYFLPVLPEQGGIVALSEEEAAHAAKVMRVKPGEAVTIFDGQGSEAEGVIESVERRQVYVQLESPKLVCREPSLSVTVAVSLPKGDRAKVLIEKLTELGVRRLVPIVCQRTQGRGGDENGGPASKLQRYVLEACKQCERNQLMEIASSCSMVDFLQAYGRGSSVASENRLLLLAHPGESTFRQLMPEKPLDAAVVCIGPEGGFADEEVSLATAAGFSAVSLGKSILRVETAATAIVAKLVLE